MSGSTRGSTLEHPEAVVLAGGLGTRLRSVVSDLPKPMAPVAGRPFLEYVLDELYDRGIRRAVLAVSYKADVVRGHFGDRYCDLELAYSVESEPLGTGGGIRRAAGMTRGRACFVVHGDTLFRVDLAALEQIAGKGDGADLVVALKAMRDFDRYGTVEFDSVGRLTGFSEKRPRREGYINGGVYFLRRALFESRDWPVKFSFETDVLEALCGEGRFRAVPFDDAYFVDIGIPEDYEKARRDLR